MKKLFLTSLITLYLWPSFVCAKVAIEAKIEAALDKASQTIQTVTEEAGTYSQQYQTLMNSREEMENAVKEEMKKFTDDFKNGKEVKVENLAIKGIGETIKSSEPTADMQAAVADKYVQTEEKNDVEVQTAFEEMINEEMINNVSAMYARGLVKRYQLQQEGAKFKAEQEAQKSDEKQPDVTAEIKKVRMRADARWISIMQAMANNQDQIATIRLTTLKSPTRPDEDAAAE